MFGGLSSQLKGIGESLLMGANEASEVLSS